MKSRIFQFSSHSLGSPFFSSWLLFCSRFSSGVISAGGDRIRASLLGRDHVLALVHYPFHLEVYWTVLKVNNKGWDRELSIHNEFQITATGETIWECVISPTLLVALIGISL